MTTLPHPELARDFSLTSHPAFFRLWLSRGLSGIAFQMQAVAIGWQLYDLTRNPLDLGLVGLVQFIPMFLSTPLAGHAADTFDRRRVAALCQVLAMTAMICIAFGTFAGWLGRNSIFALVAAVSVARAFEFPTMSALVPLTAPRHELQRATALYSSANQTAVIVGPAIGGLLYMVSPVAPYLCAAGLFVIGATAVSSIAIARVERRREPITLATIFAGAGYIRRTPELLGSMTLDLCAVVVGAATALLPIFARDILLTGPWGLGLLRAAPAVGALSTAVWLAYNPIRRQAVPLMFAGVAVFGAATVVFGLSTSLGLSLLALAVMGAADVVSVVVRQSLVQLRTPDEMRGRVGAVNAMFISASNQLGDFRAGVAAAAIGAVPAVVLGGGATILVAALWMALFPSLRMLQRVEH
jgi:MFS family permease